LSRLLSDCHDRSAQSLLYIEFLQAHPAQMHALDWNDLRYVLALAREGSYAAAGRRLGIDPTTVARRLRTIETVLGARLFERGAEGQMSPNQAGELVTKRAEIIEAEIGGLSAAVQDASSSANGTVRVTAVPILINRVLIPAARDLIADHPGLRLELVAESRDLSLTRREADIALRLARPGDETASHVLAKRIGMITYAAYARTKPNDQASDLPWLTYEEGMRHLPHARWIDKAMRHNGERSAIAVNDAEGLMHAVQAGLGISLLPCIVADHVSDIVRIGVDGGPLPEREIWLMTHPDLRHLSRIAIVAAWIERTFSKLERKSAPA